LIESIRSKFTGLLTCGAAVAAIVCLRFSDSVLQGMLGVYGVDESDLPRLAALALTLTGPRLLGSMLLVCIAVVVVSEATIEREANRLLVQGAVLLLLVLVLAISLAGFFVSFHIPDVRID